MRTDATVIADRERALAALAPADITRTLAALPHVAAALVGTGVLSGNDYGGVRRGRTARPRTLTAVAQLVAHSVSISFAVESLDQCCVRLLALAKYYGGTLTVEQALHEARPLTLDELQRAADRLHLRLLTDPERGFIALRPGVDEEIHVNGRRFRAVADQPYGTFTNDVLDVIGRTMGVQMPAKKVGKVDAIEAALADRATVTRLIAALTPEARELLDRISQSPVQPLFYSGHSYWSWTQILHPRGAISPFASLVLSGLAGADYDADCCWVWLDVSHTMNGRLFTTFVPPLVSEPKPINHIDAVPSAVGQMQSLLAGAAAEPLAGLKSGGLGVKVLRDLAKRTGQTERSVTLLLRLAIGLQLLDKRSTITGKGRKASWTDDYLPGVRSQTWAALSPAERWCRLVDGWLDHFDGDPQSYTHDPIVRRLAIADLIALPKGSGIAPTDFPGWLCSQHVLFTNFDTEALLADLRLLGLIPDAGPIGLTDAARVLLVQPALLRDHLGEAPRTFVTQPDHTIVAPPNLDSDVRSRLEHLCESVSKGGALMYRLDPTRIAAELARGNDAAAIVAFLTDHGDTPLPPAIDRFVHDIERQRGGLTVSAVGCIVTSANALSLVPVLKVKAARLTLIAPTVATSPLSAARVTAALRAKGLAPDAVASVDVGAMVVPSRAPGDASLGALPSCLAPDEELLATLLGFTAKPPPPPRSLPKSPRSKSAPSKDRAKVRPS
jgi:Helicase conserved C-terminal domain